ncbi:MAG: hypothetical protein AAF741_18145 [Bacteroidota bacterium]
MKTLLFNILLVIAVQVSAQDFFVVSVAGEIYLDGEMLAPRDQLSAESELVFVGTESQAYVMSPKKGYFVLGPASEPADNSSEFLLAVRQAILPESEWKMTATREIQSHEAGIEMEDTYDMLGYFRGRIALLDSLEIYFSPDYFSTEDGALHLIAHGGAGDTSVHRADTLQVADLVSLSDSTTTHFTLSYLPDYEDDDLLVAEPFTITSVNREELIDELGYLYELTSEEDRPIFASQIAPEYVNSRYGRMHANSLKQVLQEVLAKN